MMNNPNGKQIGGLIDVNMATEKLTFQIIGPLKHELSTNINWSGQKQNHVDLLVIFESVALKPNTYFTKVGSGIIAYLERSVPNYFKRYF